MFKQIVVKWVVLVVIIFMPSLAVGAEKVIILNDGRELTGEVISGTESSITIKSEGKVYTFMRENIKSLKKRKPREELLLPAEEVYDKLKPSKKKSDAEIHYNLGLFCLKRNLFDEARIEFNKAKKLDNRCAAIIDTQLKKLSKARIKGKYEAGKYFYNKGRYKTALSIFEKAVKLSIDDYLSKELQEMIELSRQDLASCPIPTEEELLKQLRSGEFPLPRTADMARIINSFFGTFPDEKKDDLIRYRTQYLDMAKNHLEAAETNVGAECWKNYEIALYCYAATSFKSSFYREVISSIEKINMKINEHYRGKLLIPFTINDLKWSEAFIEETASGINEKEVAVSWYYKLAKEYEAKAADAQASRVQMDLLNMSLNCYLILANSFPDKPEIEQVGLYGWARCFEKLEKLNSFGYHKD